MSSHVYNTQQPSLEDAIESILSKKKDTYVSHSVVGRWLFLALTKKNETYVISCRFFKELKETMWKMEWYDADSPPDQYTCPERILKLISNPPPTVQQWIDSCRNNKTKGAINRNENKAKLTLLRSKKAEDAEIRVNDEPFIFKGFYMHSKTEIVVQRKSDGSLNRVRLSSICLDDLRDVIGVSDNEQETSF